MEKIIKFWPQSEEQVLALMTETGNCFYCIKSNTNDLMLVEPMEPYVKNKRCSVYVIFDNNGKKYHILNHGSQVKPLDIICDYVPACFLLDNILVIAEHILAVPRLLVEEGYVFSQAKVINLLDGTEIRHFLPKEIFYSDAFVNALGNLVLIKGETVTQWGLGDGELEPVPFVEDDLKSWLSLSAMEPEKVGISSEDLQKLFDCV